MFGEGIGLAAKTAKTTCDDDAGSYCHWTTVPLERCTSATIHRRSDAPLPPQQHEEESISLSSKPRNPYIQSLSLS